MREIGLIKWYGGYNSRTDKENEFGFIESVEQGEEIFVHKRDLKCEEDYLDEGVPVAYDKVERKGKVAAANVMLLKQESLKVLEKALDFPQIKEKILDAYIEKLIEKEDVAALERIAIEKAFKAVPIQEKLKLEWIINSPVLAKNLNIVRKIDLLILGKIDCSPEKLLDEIRQLPQTSFYEKEPTRRKIAEKKDVLLKLFKTYPGYEKEFVDLFGEDFLNAMIESLMQDEQNEELAQLIVDVLKETKQQSYVEDRILWNVLSEEALRNPVLYKNAPNRKRLSFFMNHREWDKKEFIELMKDTYGEDRNKYLECKKAEISSDLELFEILNEKEKAEWFDKNRSKWEWLSTKAKIYYLYGLAKDLMISEINLSYSPKESVEFILQVEKSQFIKMLARMLLPGGDERKTTFEELDYRLNTLIYKTFENKDRLDFEPLLPGCAGDGPKYCEGRIWYKEDERSLFGYQKTEAENIWCPRNRCVCTHVNKVNNRIFGTSHCYPRVDLPVEEWTLIEYMSIANIHPNLPNLRNPDEYINRIAGWANRLDELLERAKCRCCGKTMKAHEGYAKRFDAVFNATVFNCRKALEGEESFNDVPHDTDVYVSYCWACNDYIDSRYNKIQHVTTNKGWYLCLKCGNGPKPQYAHGFKAGDICPACGNTPMNKKESVSGDKLECSKCGHEIQLISASELNKRAYGR